MYDSEKQPVNNRIYFNYILLSCFLTASLNGIHSYIIDIAIEPGSFIIPVLAGCIFGYLLAKNKLLSNHLKILAHTDMLTGVLNRTMFEKLLNREILKASRYENPFSVIFIDIDHFKNVNDQYGHPVGDQVLSDFSQLLRQLNRSSDVTARYGGEEFIILSIGSTINETITHAERLRNSVAEHAFDTVSHITCSLGITQFKKGEDTAGSLLKRADEALYDAKQNGRNRVEIRY